MALAQRGTQPTRIAVARGDQLMGDNDDKQQKLIMTRTRRRQRGWGLVGVTTLLALLYCHYSFGLTSFDSLSILKMQRARGATTGSEERIETAETTKLTSPVEDLYPFLTTSDDGSTIQVPFPIIPSLENCTVEFRPPPTRTDESTWRKPFWIPSFPSSGASNPTNQGDLAKEVITKMTGLLNKPVKNYHMTMRKRLKRCHGISETVACTQGHPLVPIEPESQRQNFQPKSIVFVRNFVTAFPASLTDKNIAYHDAKSQNSISEFEEMRNEWMQSTFGSWKFILEWWTTTDAYSVAMYVPFEDLMTTNREKGRAVLQQLSKVLQEGGFEAAKSDQHLDCIWYTVIKSEWNRQHSIMKFVPSYTAQQKEWLVAQLQQFIHEVPNREHNRNDLDLLDILNRYLQQIQDHLLVENTTRASL